MRRNIFRRIYIVAGIEMTLNMFIVFIGNVKSKKFTGGCATLSFTQIVVAFVYNVFTVVLCSSVKI